MNKLEQIGVEVESKEKAPRRRITKQEQAILEKRFNLELSKENPEEILERERHIEALREEEVLSIDHNKINEDKEEEFTMIDEVDKAHEQHVKQKSDKVKRIATNVTDFVPIIGSAKMIMEGLRGKQYGTEKEIKGRQRFIHGVSGVVFLGLDATGVGAIGSEIGKGVIKLGERAMFRSVEENLVREVIEKEATKLTARGEKRIDKQENIAEAS